MQIKRITIGLLFILSLNLASPAVLYAQPAALAAQPAALAAQPAALAAQPAALAAQPAPPPPGYPGGGLKSQPTGEPEGSGGTSQSGTGSELICRGDRDWSTFISSVLSYDDFIEYWQDLLVRYSSNICQYLDIDSLLTRLNKIREQIRKAFYVCANTTKLKDTYYRLEAELFFLRKYIDTDNGQFLVKNQDKLRNDLRRYFVLNKGFFSDEKIDELFNDFKAKYAARLTTYQNCSDPTWTELVNKWQEFKDNVLTLFTDPGSAPVIQAATKSIQKKWDRMANTSLNLGRDFFGGFLDARINGLEPAQALDQIAAELQKNYPRGYTVEQLQVAKDTADQKYDYASLEADYINKYLTLYKEVSDTVNMEIMARLQNLDKIIKGTFPFENQTVQCLKAINNKQC